LQFDSVVDPRGPNTGRRPSLPRHIPILVTLLPLILATSAHAPRLMVRPLRGSAAPSPRVSRGATARANGRTARVRAVGL